MRNPEKTKSHILNTSANLFNKHGYKATSLSDITNATGFTKGAIYKHFKNKEDLEQQALRSLNKKMFSTLTTNIKQATDFMSRMNVVFDFFENYLVDPPFEGGCPLLNSAIESDDANLVLRQQSFGMLVNLKSSIKRIIEQGIKHKQIKADINTEQLINVYIATLEGAVMMSKLERDTVAITNCIDFLKKYNLSISI